MKLYALKSGYHTGMEGPEIVSIWTTEEGVKAHMKKLMADGLFQPVGEIFPRFKNIRTNEISDADKYYFYEEIYTDSEFMDHSPEEVAKWQKEWEEGQK